MTDMQESNSEVTKDSLEAEVQAVTESEIEAAPTSTPELTETEKKAYEMGWRPKEEYQGQHFVPAEEYVNRAPLFERIERQSKELREVRQTNAQIAEHLKSLRKDAYEKALQDLETQKRNAETTGDIQQFKAASIQADSLKTKMQADPMIQPSAPAQPDIHPEALAFAERNKSWYNHLTPENQFMVNAATQFETLVKFKADNKGETLSPREILNRVEKEIHKSFPERFENMNRNIPTTVGKSTSAGTVSATGLTGLSRFLTPAQIEIGKQFMKAKKTLTLEKYAEALDAAGRLKKK